MTLFFDIFLCIRLVIKITLESKENWWIFKRLYRPKVGFIGGYCDYSHQGGRPKLS